jgi:hypothetical protein
MTGNDWVRMTTNFIPTAQANKKLSRRDNELDH